MGVHIALKLGLSLVVFRGLHLQAAIFAVQKGANSTSTNAQIQAIAFCSAQSAFLIK